MNPTPRATEPTSAEAYQVLEPMLLTRQRAVVHGLERYRRAHGGWPTSGELTRFMKQRRIRTVHDLNDVRPRLTELLAARAIGHEWSGDTLLKRKCAVTGITCLTWRLPDGRLF